MTTDVVHAETLSPGDVIHGKLGPTWRVVSNDDVTHNDHVVRLHLAPISPAADGLAEHVRHASRFSAFEIEVA